MSSSIRASITTELSGRWQLWMYPRLQEIPERSRAEALRVARETELDMLERIGIFAGLLATTLILQAVGEDLASALVRYVMQFALALPMLVIAVGPFLLRRTRRGLEIECAKFGRV